MGTINEAYISLVALLELKGFDERESKQIAIYLFEDNISKNYISERKFTTAEKLLFEKIVIRIQQNEPWQYISGKVNFYGYNFFINHHVLIPRPETEELVYHSLKAIPKDSSVQILDVGTGSGIIALAIAKKCPQAQTLGVDISAEALTVAIKNGKDLGVKNVAFRQVDFMDEYGWKDFPPLDFIISNPPYITVDEKTVMSATTLEYEPHIALFVQNNAMEFYKKIATLASMQKKSVGVFVEINEFRANEVVEVFEKTGLKDVKVILDMQGKKRIISARKI